MNVGARPFRDDPKCMILQNGTSAYSRQQSLLHSPFEPEDSHLWRWNFDVHFDFPNCQPRSQDEGSHSHSKPKILLPKDAGTTVPGVGF